MEAKATPELVTVSRQECDPVQAEFIRPRRDFQDLLARFDLVFKENGRLRRIEGGLRQENGDLRQRLQNQDRDKQRQAGPISRNKPKLEPKPPSRKSGDDYGKHHFGVVPERIEKIHTDPLPKCFIMMRRGGG